MLNDLINYAIWFCLGMLVKSLWDLYHPKKQESGEIEYFDKVGTEAQIVDLEDPLDKLGL